MNDTESLAKAMSGAYAVYAVTNYWEKMDMQVEIKQGQNLVDAAKVCYLLLETYKFIDLPDL